MAEIEVYHSMWQCWEVSDFDGYFIQVHLLTYDCNLHVISIIMKISENTIVDLGDG